MTTGDEAVGVVLAAGAGRRMGAPKAELVVDGVRLLDRAIATLRGGGCTEVIAVVRDGVSASGARLVVNPDPDRGLASSLRLGLAAAETGGADIAVVLLVDVPGVNADAVRRVRSTVAAALAAGRPGLAVATYSEGRGHPVALSRPHWQQAAAAAYGDTGLRAFMQRNPDLVTEVPCHGDSRDLDTPADLRALAACAIPAHDGRPRSLGNGGETQPPYAAPT
ncbi:nucleotidyltransferase family protein [Jatrophihabitans sp.]|uniref:nucleotidyltransferase family protein n=1 Tax=Jatrophihabitans sp. TaxID=1932789 RepID=UPI0030C75FBF|nr:hypothetical protein [Jatrophihabitans sp.]